MYIQSLQKLFHEQYPTTSDNWKTALDAPDHTSDIIELIQETIVQTPEDCSEIYRLFFDDQATSSNPETTLGYVGQSKFVILMMALYEPISFEGKIYEEKHIDIFYEKLTTIQKDKFMEWSLLKGSPISLVEMDNENKERNRLAIDRAITCQDDDPDSTIQDLKKRVGELNAIIKPPTPTDNTCQDNSDQDMICVHAGGLTKMIQSIIDNQPKQCDQVYALFSPNIQYNEDPGDNINPILSLFLMNALFERSPNLKDTPKTYCQLFSDQLSPINKGNLMKMMPQLDI